MKKGLRRSVAEIDSDLAYNASRGAVRFGKDSMWVPKGMMGALKGDGPNPQAVFCAWADLVRRVAIHLAPKPSYIGELCQKHPLFLALGYHSASFREAVRLLDPSRREQLKNNFPPSLMALFEAHVNYRGEGVIASEGAVYDGHRFFFDFEGTVTEQMVDGEIKEVTDCPWKDEGIYAYGPYDLVKVDGCVYKKPNMAKAMFIFEYFGAHDFFVGRGIPYRPLRESLNDFPVAYFNAYGKYDTEEEVRYNVRKSGWFGSFGAFRGEEGPGMRADMCYEYYVDQA